MTSIPGTLGTTAERQAAAAPPAGTSLPPALSWREAWRHELFRYYRRRSARDPAFAVPEWAGAAAILALWGLFIIGTGLAVLAYPQATQLECTFGYCTSAFSRQHPLPGVLMVLISSIGLMLICPLPVVLVLYAIVQGLRGRLPLLRKRLFLNGDWLNETTQMLLVTPPGGLGLLRIQFLVRLYQLWQRRVFIIALVTTAAVMIVSQQLVAGAFWWLGDWGRWGAQLGLTVLWIAAVFAWLAAFVTLEALNDVARMRGDWTGFLWRSVSGLVGLGVAAGPFLLLFWLGWQYRWDNPQMDLTFPLLLLGAGLVLVVGLYALAEGIMRLRLRIDRLPGVGE